MLDNNRGRGSEKPVLVILGPTASGKTSLAIKIAQALNGEVISADSRAIYKGMDIATAKPSPEEMAGVPHFGIDLVEPDERFTVVDFVAYARKKIVQIRERGHLPIIVGGTGLYIDALVYDYSFEDVAKNNCSDRTEINSDFLLLGIDWLREELRKRLLIRAHKYFEQGIEDETRRMVDRYGWGSQAMKSNAYPICWKYLQGEISEEEAVRQFELDDWHLAKRQLTWFRRNENIHWLELSDCFDWVMSQYLGQGKK